ncbi:putative secreted protein (type I secretion substrate) [Rhodobacter viridis]|uniref:Putative secreted protein (Type I secretion substrate) n=1 Tax=Rhodobacter viridis TaxID=1054202 RepID=A0A318TY31_9RHOB|nr:M10 family metallopeptidase C-terminal domain-containing protein [Rhodobacter viridis]PYF09946.1 putative secreted protein (type I secretion substrate) [Rhodobacter viridis]
MADFVLNVADDLTSINLHEIFASVSYAQLYDVTPDQAVQLLAQVGIIGGVAYDISEGVDSAVILETDIGGLALCGEGISFSNADVPTGGTVTSFINLGSTGVQSYFYYINVSAVALYNAMATVSTADDAAIFAQAFSGNDYFTLSRGADKANGMNGNDVMNGMGGADTLIGGAGSDRIIGGAGRDLMTGGTGADRFVFTTTGQTGTSATSADRITDFTHGVDRIDLHAIDASTVLSGEDAFTFIGAAAFGTTGKGEIRFEHVDAAGTASDFTLVYLDTDADTAAEAVIRLNGLVTLTAADFVL